MHGVAALLAPYSSYGRMASAFLAPVYQWGNNLLAGVAEHFESYAFYSTDIWMKGTVTSVVAAVTFMSISVLAWRNGRTYCNTVCPVGTILGFLHRFSYFKPVIDASACVSCKRCVKNCKTSCIDLKTYSIDCSRCVDCMNCISNCHKGAISYIHPSSMKHSNKSQDAHPADPSRREFLSLTALLAGTSVISAQEKKVDGGLAVIKERVIPQRETPLVPPGAQSIRNFTTSCTACQLCVSACPNGVLRPSSSLERMMQPEMSYERGYCRAECTKCSEVCPAGAIRKISVADKSSTQIGHAVWVRKNCIPLTDKVECGNCARHCPTGAITMMSSVAGDDSSVKIPAINVERCIGCGACENLCPGRPFTAIYVEGHARHRVV